MLQIPLLRGQTSNYKLLTYLNKWEEKKREPELAERDWQGKNKKKIPFSWAHKRQAKFSILISAGSLLSRTSKSSYTPRILPASLPYFDHFPSCFLSSYNYYFLNALSTSPQPASLCPPCPSPPHCHYPTTFSRAKPVLLQDADQSSEGMLTTTPTPVHVVHMLPKIKILNFY